MAEGESCSQNKAHAVGSRQVVFNGPAGPLPTLQPCGMCSVWTALLVSQALTQRERERAEACSLGLTLGHPPHSRGPPTYL